MPFAFIQAVLHNMHTTEISETVGATKSVKCVQMIKFEDCQGELLGNRKFGKN